MEGPPRGGSWCAWHVAGPAPTPETAAESLRRAGAVRGMTLDINPEWVTFNFCIRPDPANPTSITGGQAAFTDAALVRPVSHTYRGVP